MIAARAAAHRRANQPRRVHRASEHGDRNPRAGGAVRARGAESRRRSTAPRCRRSCSFYAALARDVFLAERLAARPGRLVSVQRAHGAASAARIRRRAADDHGHPGRHAAAVARSPRRRPGRAVGHGADAMFRDLQRRRRRLAPAAALQLRAGASPRAHRSAPDVSRGVGADVVAGPQPDARAAATQLPGTDAVSVLAQHPDGDRLGVHLATRTRSSIRCTPARRGSGESRR